MILSARYDKALVFATEAHKGQVRKFTGDDYIVHPIRCAITARRYGLSHVLINALLLHDVVEDCDVTINMIDADFGDAVSEIVWGLTNAEARFGAKSELKWNRAKRKAHDVEWLRGRCALTRMGKLIDLTDNLKDWPADDKFLDVFLGEVRPLGDALVGAGGIWPDVLGDFIRVFADAALRRAAFVTDPSTQ
jgi:hypothetical protein